MKNWVSELIGYVLLIICFIGWIHICFVIPENKHKKLVKENCEKTCVSLFLTIEDYYDCCNNCYNWEINK